VLWRCLPRLGYNTTRQNPFVQKTKEEFERKISAMLLPKKISIRKKRDLTNGNPLIFCSNSPGKNYPVSRACLIPIKSAGRAKMKNRY